jgi:sugar phosphate isomerase/epimerase
MISRRSFFQRVAAVPAGFSTPALRGETDYTRHLGVQLYTLRDVLPKDPDTTLREVARIGYREVEVLGDNLRQISPILKKYNLAAVSGHFDAGLITGRWRDPKPASLPDNWNAAADLAKASGLSYMVVPWIDQEDRTDEAFRAIVDKLNPAGEVCRARGMKLCYHNHAFDFAPRNSGRLIDLLLRRTDPAFVALELDVFWASVAGFDPVQVLKQFKGRVPLIHLKDKAKDTPKKYDEEIPAASFKEVGAGILDIRGILHAATAAGVRHILVEQDKTPGDPIACIRRSYEYVRNLKA